MKRIVAALLVYDGYLINSYEFNNRLPIGRIEHTLKRLQEWEIDEIAVLNLSHSANVVADFNEIFTDKVLSKLDTPLSYGGGIISRNSAEGVIRAGCERVILSSRNAQKNLVLEISESLGDQAILIHAPILSGDQLNTYFEAELDIPDTIKELPNDWGGEIFFKFKDYDGKTNHQSNYRNIISKVPERYSRFLVGGGVSSLSDIQDILGISRISGVVVGNWLNREELIVPRVKQTIVNNSVRKFQGDLE